MESINTNRRRGLFRLWIVASIAWVLAAGWYTALPGAAKGYLKAVEAKRAIPPLIEGIKKYTKEHGDGGGYYKGVAEDPWRIFDKGPFEDVLALSELSSPPDAQPLALLPDPRPVELKNMREKARQISMALYGKDEIFRPLKIIFIPPIAALMAGMMMYWAICWVVGGFHNETAS